MDTLYYVLACAPISLYDGQLPLDTCMYNNTDVCIINITRLLFSARTTRRKVCITPVTQIFRNIFIFITRFQFFFFFVIYNTRVRTK